MHVCIPQGVRKVVSMDICLHPLVFGQSWLIMHACISWCVGSRGYECMSASLGLCVQLWLLMHVCIPWFVGSGGYECMSASPGVWAVVVMNACLHPLVCVQQWL